MRKTLIALAAAGTLLVGACGDDGGDDEEAQDSESSTTMPEQSGEHAEFCTALLESMQNPSENATGLPDLEPPAEIAEDYQLMEQAYERISEIDPNASDFQQQQEAIQEELGGQERFNEAQTNMTQFIMENCNMPNEGSMDSTVPDGNTAPSTTAEE